MEQPVISATSVLLKYDRSSGKWLEMGSQSGTCNVTILKSPANEYRFVGWKESNQEVVLNSYLFPSMNYSESTPTFHQWYDEGKNAHGLNFLDANEAKKFGIAVNSAIEILNSSKITKPGGDNISVPKKSVEKSPGYRTTNRKYSVDRQPLNNPTVSPYATAGIHQNNDSATVKVPTVPTGKPQVSSAGAPPPPGPPPAAPPPPGPPPSGPPPPGLAPAAPSLPSIKKPAANDFASQLKAKSEAMKPTSTNSNAENISRGSPTPPVQSTQPTSSKPPQMDFLSELKLKSQQRPMTQDGINQPKKTEQSRTSATTVNITSKNPIQSSKPPSSNQDPTTTSFVTSADLEKFRADLLQDIVSNMEKFKEDIINGIISKLN